MADYNDLDFSPDWISRDLDVSFDDIMNVFATIDFEDDDLDLKEVECNNALQLITAIR